MLRLGWFGRHSVLALCDLHLATFSIDPETRKVKVWQWFCRVILPCSEQETRNTRLKVEPSI